MYAKLKFQNQLHTKHKCRCTTHHYTTLVWKIISIIIMFTIKVKYHHNINIIYRVIKCSNLHNIHKLERINSTSLGSLQIHRVIMKITIINHHHHHKNGYIIVLSQCYIVEASYLPHLFSSFFILLFFDVKVFTLINSLKKNNVGTR